MKKNFILKVMIFIWHGFFLSLTMSMLDFNTVFPSLINELIESRIIFGILYSIMLGAPLIFNIIFSYYLQNFKYKKKFLLFGIYLRSLAFLGMAIFVYLFANDIPLIVINSFFFWILLFSISGGFAGLAFTDIIGKLFDTEERGRIYSYKQFFSSLAAFMGGLIVSRIFSFKNLSYPENYSLILLIGSIGLFIASIAFWFINEPPSTVENKEKESLFAFLKNIPSILRADQRFSRFIIVENMTSLSLMIMPFYIIFAQETFLIDETYIGLYLLFQIGGTIISNFFWNLISRKLSVKMVVQICIFLGAIIPILAISISPLGPDIFVIIFVLIGFVKSGRKIGFDPYLLNLAPPRKRTVYLGVRGSLNFLLVLMPIIGGLFIDIVGFYITFSVVSVVMISAFYLLGRKTK